MWHVHHTMIHVIYCSLYEIYCIILSVLFSAVFMFHFHPPVFARYSWQRSAISCQSVVIRLLYTFAYHLFILSKINWQFVLHFASEPVCTFKYMVSFIEPLRFVCLAHDVLSMFNFIYDSYACFFLFSYTDFYFRKIRWSLFFTNSMYCIIVLVMWISCTKSLF